MLEAEKRRQVLLDKLENNREPLKGTELAQLLGVSRQVVVQDVALLRAKGNKIFATPQGYILADRPTNTFRATVACQHNFSGLKRELEIIIEHGGRVLDVTVEHPIYGELQGLLMIKTMKEVENFVEKLRVTEAKPLSALTNGVHLHTIEATEQRALDEIIAVLEKEGFLLY